MISFKENVWDNFLYLDVKGRFKFLKSSDWFSLRTNLPFTMRLINIKKISKKINLNQ